MVDSTTTAMNEIEYTHTHPGSDNMTLARLNCDSIVIKNSMVVACHVCIMIVAGHESEQGALAIQVASKQNNKHSLYLTLVLQLK